MKLQQLLLTTGMVFSSMALSALPIGNPWEAKLLKDGVFCEGYCGDLCSPEVTWCEALSYRAGYYGDFVNNRHLEVRDELGSVQQTQLETNAAYLALNLYNRVEFFTTLGATSLKIETPAKPFGASFNRYAILETDTHFSWSLGGYATLWEVGCLGIGVEAQYFFARPTLNYFQVANIEPIYLDREHLRYQEWQLGVAAAYDVCLCNYEVLPYVGIKWSHAYVNLGHLQFVAGDDPVLNIHLRDLSSTRDFGFAVGLTLVGYSKFALTLEKRFLDERAFYLNAQVRI